MGREVSFSELCGMSNQFVAFMKFDGDKIIARSSSKAFEGVFYVYRNRPYLDDSGNIKIHNIISVNGKRVIPEYSYKECGESGELMDWGYALIDLGSGNVIYRMSEEAVSHTIDVPRNNEKRNQFLGTQWLGARMYELPDLAGFSFRTGGEDVRKRVNPVDTKYYGDDELEEEIMKSLEEESGHPDSESEKKEDIPADRIELTYLGDRIGFWWRGGYMHGFEPRISDLTLDCMHNSIASVSKEYIPEIENRAVREIFMELADGSGYIDKSPLYSREELLLHSPYEHNIFIELLHLAEVRDMLLENPDYDVIELYAQDEKDYCFRTKHYCERDREMVFDSKRYKETRTRRFSSLDDVRIDNIEDDRFWLDHPCIQDVVFPRYYHYPFPSECDYGAGIPDGLYFSYGQHLKEFLAGELSREELEIESEKW